MTRREKLIKLIEERLNKNEVINYYVEGAFESTVNGRQNTMTGILVTTNEKIRFCGKRFFLVYDDIIEYKDIEYVEANEEKLGHKIFITGKEKSYSMKFIISKDVHNFVDSINKNL
ncbi:PH domain-containing protein [Clostridium sp. UBA3887]|uniref:PH domain-containing protein n=1 Tax=Clostridium sp. UBA3887 TaxID=1946356 RepID=UPI00321730FC